MQFLQYKAGFGFKNQYIKEGQKGWFSQFPHILKALVEKGDRESTPNYSTLLTVNEGSEFAYASDKGFYRFFYPDVNEANQYRPYTIKEILQKLAEAGKPIPIMGKYESIDEPKRTNYVIKAVGFFGRKELEVLVGYNNNSSLNVSVDYLFTQMMFLDNTPIGVKL